MKTLFKSKQFLLLLCLLMVNVCYLSAQDYRAIVRGVVTDEIGEGVIGATVLVKNESTGFSAGSITNETGEYIVKQLPLGSPYSITVSYIGYGDQKKTGYTLNQGDVLRLDFQLKEESVVMEAVQVVANSLKNSIATTGAATSVTANDLNKLPVNGRNFTSLIDLSPLSTGSSLSGQLASSTNYTIDGMSAKGPTSGGSTTSRNGVPYAISMEAIREFKVVTNEYDVTNGRAGGGTISTVTKSGTNQLTGSAFAYLRSDWLSSKYDIRGNKRTNDFSTYQYGASLGGALVKDRAHFFISWDHQADSRPLYIADIQTAADEKRLSLTADTRDRFLEIARGKYGVSNNPQFGSFDKKQNTDAVFARLDWQINATNLLSFTENLVNDNNGMGLGDNSSINIYEVYGDVHSLNNSATLALRSVLGPRSTNELKLQHLYTLEESMPGSELPSVNIPRGIVEDVTSQIDGKTATTTIQLGGQRYCPENFYNHVLQLVDNYYYNTNKVNYTYGFDLMYTNLNSRYGSEANGRFFFSGLDNFEALKPYRYVREVYLDPNPDNQRVHQNILNAGVYAQLQTKLFNGFELIAGLRLDNATYFNKGNFSQLVYDELGLRTDNGMSTFQIQPRVQITWDFNDKHTDILRVGGGIFASDINNYAMINNMVFDGTKVMSLDIKNTKYEPNIVPVPDFVSYRKDPSTVPGIDLLNDPKYAAKAVPTINMNSKDSKVPVVYKANISYTHFFSDRLKMSVSGYMTLGRNNYMYVDRNMVDDPYFRLLAEGNRGIYVPASAIDEKGKLDWMEGRKSTKVGRVLELVSEGKVNQFAFTVDGTWRYYKDGELSFSYTWNDTKDNTSYNGNVANSATLSQMVVDDPRDLSKMTYSNNQFRHKLVVYGSAPTFWGVTVGARFSGIGGTRYSLIVNGNVNGDFVDTNDLAYVYDPNNSATPEYIRDGINSILNNPDAEQSLKDYIRKSFGKVAERNGGVNGFYGTLDLRLAKKFKTFKKQNLEVSVDIFNVANMLSKDWGSGHNLGTQRIYSIKGFNQTSKQYTYNVNANTGVSSLNGTPFQVQIGLRYGF
ncbi:MAG: carboxypeptidase regulatory-like domain-containing protein [Bacteroides sp.]|nr:carboxypeptidase regulatory-like domain-containing protein [Bacteroides sp.]